MQPCFLRIVTSADGEESVFSQYAEMELTPLSAVLRYTQGAGRVFLRVSREGVLVEREGDYALKLYLSEGQTNGGRSRPVGDGGKSGNVRAPHRIFDRRKFVAAVDEIYAALRQRKAGNERKARRAG